jgi:hypothetical protein
MNKPVTVIVGGETPLVGTIIGTFGKSGKQKVYLKEDIADQEEGILEKLGSAEVELRFKVYSKEIAKMKNIK